MIRPKSAISINTTKDIFVKNKSRPSSVKYKYPFISQNQIMKNSHVIIYSMPNNPKLSKGMGKSIEKEELYENTVHLKILINKLKKELDESKSNIIQKEMEIKKKNKIINDFIKDNDIDKVNLNNLEKGKESTLLTLCKEKYFEMKKLYKKKCEENEILKANIKITKIKEIQIECDILKSELEKMKNLYLNSQEQIQSSNQKMNNLQMFKNKFFQQNLLINSLQKNCDELNISNKQLKQEILRVNNNLEKKEKEKRKLKIVNNKLKINNEKYLSEKKDRENILVQQKDNVQKIIELQKQIIEYKRLYEQKCKEIQHLNKYQFNSQNLEKENLHVLKSMDYNLIKDIRPYEKKEDNKILLLKNLLKDSQIKNKIYEDFLKENNCEINQILEEGGYNNGVINNSSPNLIRSFSNPNTTNNNNINSIENNTNYYSTNNINNQQTSNNNNIQNTNSDIKYVDNLNDIIQMKNTSENKENEEEELFKSLDFIILKNLEANNVKKENLFEEVNQIYKTFEENTKTDNEISRDDFIKPFAELIINNMKIKNNDDITIIYNYLGKIIDGIEDDIDKFFEHLYIIFDNIIDYSQINENEFLLKIKSSLEKYPELIKELKEKDINNDNIISILNFKKITDKLGVELNDDLMEFLIYKMKSSVPENYSMLDLNYSIIETIINNDLSENNEIIINLFKQLKISLNEKNQDLNDVIFDKIINVYSGNSEIQGIKKNDFYEIFKDNGIGIGENEQNEIYDYFKLEKEINEDDDLLNISRIKELYESD